MFLISRETKATCGNLTFNYITS